MNSCLELHYPDDVLERYAMGNLSALECVPIEEHLLMCTACQTNLLAVEEYILVTRAALAPVPPRRSHRLRESGASDFYNETLVRVQ
jgi:predicted anti-sigma-YlaC factor YlaD